MAMCGRKIAGMLLVFLVAAVAVPAGCLSPASPAAGPGEADGNATVDLRFSLSPPEYVSRDWIENRQWTTAVLIVNAGNAAADGYCINVSLVRNTTGEVIDSRYVQYICGKGCIAPGTRHDNVATFRPGWHEKGYYRVIGGSCGGIWNPVSPLE